MQATFQCERFEDGAREWGVTGAKGTATVHRTRGGTYQWEGPQGECGDTYDAYTAFRRARELAGATPEDRLAELAPIAGHLASRALVFPILRALDRQERAWSALAEALGVPQHDARLRAIVAALLADGSVRKLPGGPAPRYSLSRAAQGALDTLAGRSSADLDGPRWDD